MRICAAAPTRVDALRTRRPNHTVAIVSPCGLRPGAPLAPLALRGGVNRVLANGEKTDGHHEEEERGTLDNPKYDHM